MLFVGGKRSFAGRTGDGDLGVSGLFVFAKRLTPIALALDAVFDAEVLQPVTGCFRAVGGIGIECRLIAQKQGVAFTTVMDVAGGDGLAEDETILVDAGMYRKAKRGLVAAAAVGPFR